MESLKTSIFFYLLPVFLFFSSPYLVMGRTRFPLTPTIIEGEASPLQTYIVHVQHLENAVFSGSADRESWYNSFLPTTIASSSKLPRMIYTYNNVINGFAARLTEQEVKDMEKMEGFVQAYPDRLYSLQTTHTPFFLGLHLQQGIWNHSNFGKGVIVGLLDSGVFPDHPSFSGNGMPPPPSKWKGRCDFNASLCNNKLIGARSFISGVTTGPPTDEEGHGTHTASTAAGGFVEGAEVLGNAKGTAVGMAPLAHLAMYKVCTEVGCAGSDILAGLDAAVEDGVDVLSLSLGGESVPFYQDPIAIGAFGAIQKGIFVSCAGGNSGPNISTVSNEAPWILTVAASTMDRSIRASVRLGNGREYDGESLFQPPVTTPTFFPLVYAGVSGNPDSAFCGNGSFDGFDVKGKIVLCERGGGIGRIQKGAFVKSAGGIGMILKNELSDGYSTLADPHLLPASHVSYSDGSKIKAYINSSNYPMANIIFKGTILGTSPAPAITSFSSRGPSLATPGILKPDITGPGVSVLAAWPFQVGPPSPSYTGPTFNIISGTSMSTPHLSGIAALIKAAHPDWSPAAIKSAIMTTSDRLDRRGLPIVDERHLPADLFATGAGHVNPGKANDPGLVYDQNADDYIPYLCGLGYTSDQVTFITRRRIDCSTVKNITEGELNYPSFAVSFGSTATSITYERTVKNVGDAKSTYWLEFIDAPEGVLVSVDPMRLEFSKVNEEKKYQVTFIRIGGAVSLSQGYLMWVSGKYTVRSPISVTFE